jgi:hypothetical protein
MHRKVPHILLRRFRKMKNGLILDGVDGDLGEKFIWQQQHQADRGHHQGEGEENGNSIATGFRN